MLNKKRLLLSIVVVGLLTAAVFIIRYIGTNMGLVGSDEYLLFITAIMAILLLVCAGIAVLLLVLVLIGLFISWLYSNDNESTNK